MENRAERITELALELIGIQSIVGTEGESEIINVIFRRISSLPYFRRFPNRLFYASPKSDPLGRKAVIAVIEAGTPSGEAVLCLGHTDTVGVSDYAGLADFATDPDELFDRLGSFKLDEDAKADLESGNYIFGRGIFDMKTGVAALLILLEDMCGDAASLKSNLVFAFVPDEEGNSCGMLAAVEALDRMASDRGWSFIAAVDTDYMTGRYQGDDRKYVYIGSVGKLLPSFYIHGEQSHVGEAFKGLDANFLAGFLMSRIDMNPKFCDIADNEATQPPISLRMKDLKDEYSVQTAGGAHLYFNYSTHTSTPDVVIERLRKEAEASFDEALQELSSRYSKHLDFARLPQGKLPWKVAVMTYSDLLSSVRDAIGDRLDGVISSFEQGPGSKLSDPRDYALELVREVHRYLPDQGPRIIVYFSAPYYPHIYVEGSDKKEIKLIRSVDQAIIETRASFRYDIVSRKFYPYISDLSYCRAPFEKEALDSLSRNLPGWGSNYSLPFDAISRLSMPVVNIGPYGKDAHKMTERLSRDYSLDAMPYLLERTVRLLMEP